MFWGVLSLKTALLSLINQSKKFKTKIQRMEDKNSSNKKI